jgi:lipoprotein-anchoring transpeptidase ErfK/SrfK
MLRYFNVILILTMSIISSAQNKIIKEVENYILKDFHEIIFVSIKNQKLYHIKNNRVINNFSISSSKYGTGNKNGSNKTPLGLHKIKEKYGEGVPINGKMVGRIFYNQIANIYKDTTESKTDDITSRILWLEGIEKGKNKGEGIDSYNRYIYIHGTSEEGKLGTPASHGCIRMKNKDVIDLYNKVEVGTLVLIL